MLVKGPSITFVLIFLTHRLQKETLPVTSTKKGQLSRTIIQMSSTVFITLFCCLTKTRPKAHRRHFWKQKYVIHNLPDDIKITSRVKSVTSQ